MSAAQIHPEDLLDRAKRGSLGEGEQRLLNKHLERCAACRFELSLAPALFAQIELDAADDAMIARAVAKARRARRFARPGLARKAMRAAVVVAAALAVAAVASAGAYAWRRHTVARLEAPPLAHADPAPRNAGHGEETKLALPLPDPAPPAEPAFDAPEGAREPSRPRAVAAPKHTDDAKSVERALCADRFRRAGEIRRSGAPAEAVRLYQELRATCAGSSEELSSRVLAGRIYLDRLSDPSRALAAFESYLGATSNGALREDAMIGRALALGRLDRLADETSAWQMLLLAYPDSLYAEKARSRLNRTK